MRLPNALLLAAIALPTSASAATLAVPATYPTVAAAVAASSAGDEIVVDSTAYVVETAPIVVATSLTIRSTGGSASTELPALHVDGGDLVLSGFTIAIRDLAVIATHGQAALFVDAGTLVGDDLVLVPQAWPTYSFGLLSQYGDVTLTKVTADGFTAIAPLWFENSTFDVTSATLTNNSDVYGGYSGALLSNTSVGTVDSSTFTGNVGPQTGAIFSMFGDLTVTNSTFEGNNGPWGGAMLLGDGVITIEDSTFTDNVADLQAGDLWVTYDADVAVIGSTFSGGAVTDTSYAAAGGSIYVTNTGAATVTDSAFTASYAFAGGAFAQDATGALTLDGVTVDGTTADFGGAAASNGGALVIRDSTFVRVSGGACGALLTYGPTTIDATTFTEISATYQGGAICGQSATIEVTGSAFDTVWSGTEGGLAELHGGAMALWDTTITDTSTVGVGGVFWLNGTNLSLESVTQTGAKASDGGVIADYGKIGSRVTVHDSTFTENTVTGNGGFYLSALRDGEVELVRNRICHNSANVGAAVYTIGPVQARNNVFLENSDLKGATFSAGNVTDVVNNTFLDNVTPFGAMAGTSSTTLTFTNNIVQGSDVGIGFQAAPAITPVGGYDLWWGNTADADAIAVTYFPTATDLFADPAYQGFTSGDCDSNLYLTPASPANNTGDPSILNPDGTRSDVGAYGGPDAVIPDGDGDGSPADEDCDDTDATVYPGAAEVPYDGIDQDCDGEDECDVDDDGHAALACDGGDDCDDADDNVHPDATEIPYDGIDQDCSGDDLCDVDADGFDDEACPDGDDCADDDAAVNPDATDLPDDGIDQDCDGADATAGDTDPQDTDPQDTDPQDTDPADTDEGETWVQGGCDCSVEGGSPASFAWLGALALLGITRRRR